jgi:LPXTG-site transpeptidase (sortase) family protein
MLLVMGAGIAYPLWWDARSAAGGKRLLHESFETSTTTTTVTTVTTKSGKGKARTAAVCEPFLPSAQSQSAHLVGVLEIPELDVRAPVVQGVSDSVLNIAVGHDAASPWPGLPGLSILEAHDVSYFSDISNLRVGQSLTWVDGCGTSTFRVVSTEVAAPGSPLAAPSGGTGLALVTCWPTNALWWTPERYIVETSYVSTTRSASKPVAAPEDLPDLRVPAPPSLVAEGLTLATNGALLGTLAVIGQPSSAFSQGPGALAVQALGLEAYFATQKAIAADDLAWWEAISVPDLALPASWSDKSLVNVTIYVNGSTVQFVKMSSRYVLMVLKVEGRDLLVSSVYVAKTPHHRKVGPPATTTTVPPTTTTTTTPSTTTTLPTSTTTPPPPTTTTTVPPSTTSPATGPPTTPTSTAGNGG